MNDTGGFASVVVVVVAMSIILDEAATRVILVLWDMERPTTLY
jgi:hypothetical protein